MAVLIQENGDRRKVSRLPADFPVSHLDSGKNIGHAVNLSDGGLCIHTREYYSPGRALLLECELSSKDIPVKAYGQVRWCEEDGDDSYQAGIEFTSIFDSDKNKLKNHALETSKQVNSDLHTLADFSDIPDKDLFKKADVYWEYGMDMVRKGFDRYRRPLTSSSGHSVTIADDFTDQPKEMIMMASNNYLGLTSHPKVVQAAKQNIEKYGTGAGSVPLLAGTYDIHRELEFKLAALKETEDAIIFPSGYVTNLGTIQTLVKKDDVAIIDRLAHASVIDGCLISTGNFRTFKHSDVDSLENVLERTHKKFNGQLVVVDGVYSMGGDIAPLRQITEIAHHYGARVMVDEAHATGVVGDRGRGTPDHLKMKPGEVDIIAGTLSKSLGGIGGFIASTKEIVTYLRFYTRSFFFSSNVPPSVAASVLAALEVMESEEQLHRNLWRNIKYMKENLKSMGYSTGETESAIIPVIIGNELTMKRMGRDLHEQGIYANAIPFPAVPQGQERFRMSIMATHTQSELDKTLECMETLGKKYDVIPNSGKSTTYTRNSYIIREISDKEEIERSVRFSWEVYKNHPAWVPYFLIKDQVKLISGDYYYFRKVYTKRFVVEEQGKIVATASAFVDNYHNRYRNLNVGFIGFFEALPDKHEAVKLLFDTATEFLKSEGCTEIQGPVNGILGLFGGGLLSSNFGRTPTFLQVYTQPYYHDYFRSAGLSPIKRLLHYTIDTTSDDNVKHIKELSQSTANSEIRIRRINKSNWDSEIKKIASIFNDSLAQLWGNVPFEYDEFNEFAHEFKDLIMPEFWLIAEIGDKPIGFIGGFPQFAPLFRDFNGNLTTFKMLKTPFKMSNIKEGVLIIVGILDEHRGNKLGTALLSSACSAMIDKGYTKIAGTWIFEDNKGSRQIVEKLGGVVDIDWQIYGQGLDNQETQ